jgi:hypothetical protein
MFYVPESQKQQHIYYFVFDYLSGKRGVGTHTQPIGINTTACHMRCYSFAFFRLSHNLI